MPIAIYHLSIKVISRGKGKSAVAAAAYRAGEKITNQYDGQVHDYTRKKGIAHTEILLPDHAPREYADRATLWNAVEQIEKNRNSQLAREIEIALPIELSAGQNIALVREYCAEHFVSKGMCADICIHDTGTGNPHAHIMLTMRPIEQDGRWAAKSKKEYLLDENGERILLKSGEYKSRKVSAVDWNEQTKAEEWRAAWADITNRHLEKLNHAERIDHRSFERQGKTEIPTIHLGLAAHQMEQKEIRTERGDINREIVVTNQKLRQLRAQIVKLQNWVKEEAENTESPTLADVITNILTKREQAGQRGRYSNISSIKAAAKVLNFLTENKITDMADLEKKVSAMYGRQFGINDKLKSVERRIKTIDEHLRHSGNYKAYRGQKAQYEKLYAEYETLKKSKGFMMERKAQKALDTANEYREAHRPQIVMYENAERYLRDVLQGRFDPKKLPPVAKWTAEREQLTAEKKRLNRDYVSLKAEVDEVYKIQRSVKDIMREEIRTAPRTRSQEIER